MQAFEKDEARSVPHAAGVIAAARAAAPAGATFPARCSQVLHFDAEIPSSGEASGNGAEPLPRLQP